MRSGTFINARRFAVLAVILAISSAAHAGWPLLLSNGVPVTGISDVEDGELFYAIEVPSGQSELEISISGGTGDCDLYVRKGWLPTLTKYDYRPFQADNEETVTVYDPVGGTWYIMLHGSDAYDDVTLVASYTPSVPEEIDNGETVSSNSGAEASAVVYYIEVPPGQEILDIRTWGGTGDVSLYVRQGAIPTIFDHDDSSGGFGTEQEISINYPAAGTWYILLYGYQSYFDVSLKATYGIYGSFSMLYDESPITGLSGGAGSEDCYAIDIPSGQDGILFMLSDGTGDCDMYIRKDYRPTETEYDYRPTDPGTSTESISLGAEEGRWFVLLKGDTAYSGVTLEADYWEPPDPTPVTLHLRSGELVAGLEGDIGTELSFSINVPTDAQRLEIVMSGGTGDADLFVRRSEPPTTANHDYRPYKIGNEETVVIDKPAAGTWYIMIRGYQPFADVTLVATHDGAPSPKIPELKNGVPVAGLEGDSDSEQFYLVKVPKGQTKLEIRIFGGTGDVDLFVRAGDLPTRSKWDYRPFLIGNDETVTIVDPKAETYYILLRGYRKYAKVTLVATYEPAAIQLPVLENCVPLTDLAGEAGSETLYAIEVPADQASLRIEMSGGIGDADLYIKKGSEPSIKSYDYRPFKFGNDEVVEVQNPAATTWYIMVQGYKAYSGVTLEACYKAIKK